MVEVRSHAGARQVMRQALTPVASPSFHAAVAATAGTASALMRSDALALGKAGKAAGFGLTLIASRSVANVLFPNSIDKPKHAVMSAAVTGGVTLLTRSRLVGIGAGVAVGLLKECYDGSRFNPSGNRDFRLNGDLGADAIGIVLGSLIR